MPIFQGGEINSLTQRNRAPQVAPTISRHVGAERIAKQVEDLGPLPAVAMEVMQLTEDPDSDARTLQSAISRDPVIAAKVLKMANSAFFSKGQPCQTLQQAATRLGMKMVRNLVVSSCVAGMMSRPLAHYGYEPFGMQKHSLALALMTGEVIRVLGLPRVLVDELFLGGLLHDTGKLVLDPLLGSATAMTGTLCVARERELTGTDHCAVGVLMAEQWKLPAHANAVIGHHHDVARAPAEFRNHVAVVHLTDWIMNRSRTGLAEHAAVDDLLDTAALAALGTNRERAESLADELDDALGQVLQFCASVL